MNFKIKLIKQPTNNQSVAKRKGDCVSCQSLIVRHELSVNFKIKLIKQPTNNQSVAKRKGDCVSCQSLIVRHELFSGAIVASSLTDKRPCHHIKSAE